MICKYENCSNLSSVIIGNSVTSIGEQTFRLCKSLANVYSYAEKVPECVSPYFVFSGSNYKHATLHVPAESVSAYQAVEPWKNFMEIVALTDSDPQPTGIKEVSSDVTKAVQYYSIDGKRIATPQRGLNIIRTSDGKMKKVVMK